MNTTEDKNTLTEAELLNRREMLHLSALGGAAALGGGLIGPLVSSPLAHAADEKKDVPPAFAGRNQMKPLPIDPKKLKGLSEKLITSHYENNYGGAVKNLNKVEQQLAQTTKDTPGFVAAGLGQSALTFRNSMILHEFYFGNLGGNGKPQGGISKKLSETYGSLGRWEELFRQIGAGLAGGSGWVILSYDFRDQSVATQWSGNHTQVGAFSMPLLVMDMYEHAYQMDYGAAAAKYIDAFFQNVNWEEVEKRWETAQKARLG
jgi:Fe-Mn family superoxide dismutase